MDVGIVGAGAAASAAAHVLDTRSDAEVTVLEKSGGLCGRAATRRRGPIRYDYGANYLKDEDKRVVELVTETLATDGLGTIDEPIWVFDGSGDISPGRDAVERKWCYEQGLTQIAKRLLGGTDAAVHRRTRVDQIERERNRWQLIDADGTVWGPFDVLLCNPPAPQTATLLRNANWDHPARDAVLDAAQAVTYRTIWTAVLGYEFELDVPYYALVNPGKDHPVGWISREECKPGHVPEGSVLIVQASHEWSVAHYDDPPNEAIDRLASLTADVVGDDRLGEPAWTDHQGWRYALPEGAPNEAVREGESAGLYCLGDWVAGEARLHAALGSGLAVGERVVAQETSER